MFSVDNFYDTEAPFQIFWFAANAFITLVLTILILLIKAQKLDSLSVNVLNISLNFDPHQILNLEIPVIENPIFFPTVIATIFVTGIVSLVLFFVMRHFKCAQPISLTDMSSLSESVQKAPVAADNV